MTNCMHTTYRDMEVTDIAFEDAPLDVGFSLIAERIPVMVTDPGAVLRVSYEARRQAHDAT